jgi:tetratricopeptide (TPR) repeat protein
MRGIPIFVYTKMAKTLHIIFFLFFAYSNFAQGPDQTEEKITDLLSMGNYKGAIPLYQKLLKKHPDNYEYKYQLGKCYLKTKGDPKVIIDLLESSIPHLKLDAEPFYYL